MPQTLTSRGVVLLCFLSLSGIEKRAAAQDLRSVLIRAYATNNALASSRQGLAATDEQVPQALSAGRPSVQASGRLGYTRDRILDTDPFGPPPSGQYPARSAVISATQDIYRGDRTRSEVAEAKAHVRSAREQLAQTEESKLFQVAQDYVNVAEASLELSLYREDVEYFAEQERSMSSKLAIGEADLSDKALASAASLRAQAQERQALGRLNAERADFLKDAGFEPGSKLDLDVSLPPLGSKRDDYETAFDHRAELKQATADIEGAWYNIRDMQGNLLPTLSLQGIFAREEAPPTNSVFKPVIPRHRTPIEAVESVVLQLRVPLYDGGSTASKVRAARYNYWSKISAARDTQVGVLADIDSAFDGWRAAQDALNLLKASAGQMAAARSAVEAQRSLGEKSEFDLLTTRENETEARIDVLKARRDLLIAALRRVKARGTFVEDFIGPGRFNPEIHYNRVKDRLW